MPSEKLDEWFSDGMPRVVSHCVIEDGIMFVLNRVGESVPVWSDHRLTVDYRSGCHCYYMHEWQERRYGSGPLEPRSYTDYVETPDEAFLSARLKQEQIAREEGEQVPILFNNR